MDGIALHARYSPPKAGALLAAPNAGVLVAPNPKPPAAGCEVAAPKSPVPVAGVEAAAPKAPKAGVLAAGVEPKPPAPKGDGLDAPNPGAA